MYVCAFYWNVYNCYFSISVIKHHYQGKFQREEFVRAYFVHMDNCPWWWSRDSRWQAMTVEVEVGVSHLKWQAQSREKIQNVLSKLSKHTRSDSSPPSRPILNFETVPPTGHHAFKCLRLEGMFFIQIVAFHIIICFYMDLCASVTIYL